MTKYLLFSRFYLQKLKTCVTFMLKVEKYGKIVKVVFAICKYRY